MQVLVINGPNINLLGAREPDTYGSVTMDEINQSLEALAKANNISISFYQSNIEGQLVDKIQEASQAKMNGIIINPAAYTHTSVAIRDAIAASKIPTIEVHLSNVYKREEFRHKSITAPVCKGQICGFGAESYRLALRAFIDANNDDGLNKDFSSLAQSAKIKAMNDKNPMVSVEQGKITPLEPLDKSISGKARLIFEDEISDWDDIEKNPGIVSEKALKKIWDNPEDDIYNDL